MKLSDFIKEEGFSKFVTKYWKIIIVIFIILILFTCNSHNVNQKIIQNSKIKEEFKKVNSEFVDTRTYLMKLKNEENIIKEAKKLDLKPIKEPPVKIILNRK